MDLREGPQQPEVEGGLPSPQPFSDCMHRQTFEIPVVELCLDWGWGRVASGVADLGADTGAALYEGAPHLHNFYHILFTCFGREGQLPGWRRFPASF